MYKVSSKKNFKDIKPKAIIFKIFFPNKIIFIIFIFIFYKLIYNFLFLESVVVVIKA